MPSDWLAIVRQTYRKYLAGAGQSKSAFRTSLLPLTSRPSPLTFRPRLSLSQFAPRSFPLADRPSQFAPRSFPLAPQCPSRNSIANKRYVKRQVSVTRVYTCSERHLTFRWNIDTRRQWSVGNIGWNEWLYWKIVINDHCPGSVINLARDK